MALRRRIAGVAEREQLGVLLFMRSALLRLAGPEPYPPHVVRDLAAFDRDTAALRRALGEASRPAAR